jgi:hypothetical protein
MHEGVSIQKGRGYARVYSIKHLLPRKRTHDESFKSAIDVVKRVLPEINGVKEPSYLYLIPILNIIDGSDSRLYALCLLRCRETIFRFLDGKYYHIDAQAIDVILLITIKHPVSRQHISIVQTL